MEVTQINLEEFHISQEYEKKPKSKKFSKNHKIRIVKMDPVNLEIDFIGFHTSLVNAYRRIILAEVPTMAIEKIYMYNNTSIVQDEVLSHRIGLVPLKVDPRLFEFRSKDDTEWGPQDTVKFSMDIKCTKNKNVDAETCSNPNLRNINRNVLSSSLKWVPLGNQSDIFSKDSIRPLHEDILLAKLNPGHFIQLEAYAVKGIGSDHAKYQPGLTWYRQLPQIELLRDVEGEDAHLLQRCFSPGVIDVVNKNGRTLAEVNDARYDACSRNVYEYDSIKDSVKLTRKVDHIIFHVESHSYLKSNEILEESVKIMISKCDHLITELNKYLEQDED